jgi:chromosome segregation ATPase
MQQLTKENDMRETRRSLKAENIQLRSQIAVHNHVTRASLHDYIKGLTERNQHAIDEYKNLEASYAGLQAQYTALLELSKQPAAA